MHFVKQLRDDFLLQPFAKVLLSFIQKIKVAINFQTELKAKGKQRHALKSFNYSIILIKIMKFQFKVILLKVKLY